MVMLRDRARELAERYEVADCACEIYTPGRGRHRGATAMQWTHGLVNIELVSRGFPAPLYIAPPTLKKWMTGTGKAEKEDVMFALEVGFGFVYTDDNIADAVSLATMLIDYHRWLLGMTRGDLVGTEDADDREYTKYEVEKMENWERVL
jgi:Holliday junction resolvasome RuvABC endonuclease subunit